jgi:hypothetical protein
MTEDDARVLQRDINRALIAGVVHFLVVVFVLGVLVQRAGGSISDIAYAGPNVRSALVGPPMSIAVSLNATTIVLATPLSGRAWLVPLISAGLGIAWVGVWGLVGLATP